MLYDPLDLLSELESSNRCSPTYPRGLPVELLHLVTLLGLGVARVDDIIDVEGGCSVVVGRRHVYAMQYICVYLY
jgi:hypothetical protein